mmetsp:Transcript_30085/g.74123  ORF Transcript_30085/g.74123 Transcript_30085/m.74123 type:complete len:272 (-) Transcript_30085:465-1280(-)
MCPRRVVRVSPARIVTPRSNLVMARGPTPTLPPLLPSPTSFTPSLSPTCHVLPAAAPVAHASLDLVLGEEGGQHLGAVLGGALARVDERAAHRRVRALAVLDVDRVAHALFVLLVLGLLVGALEQHRHEAAVRRVEEDDLRLARLLHFGAALVDDVKEVEVLPHAADRRARLHAPDVGVAVLLGDVLGDVVLRHARDVLLPAEEEARHPIARIRHAEQLGLDHRPRQDRDRVLRERTARRAEEGGLCSQPAGECACNGRMAPLAAARVAVG